MTPDGQDDFRRVLEKYNLVSSTPSPKNVEERNHISEAVIGLEETLTISRENIINEPVEVEKDEKQDGLIMTQVSEQRTVLADQEGSQLTTPDKKVVDEQFSLLASSFTSWSENTANKLKDVDRISRELDQLKEDIQDIKLVLTTITKILAE